MSAVFTQKLNCEISTEITIRFLLCLFGFTLQSQAFQI